VDFVAVIAEEVFVAAEDALPRKNAELWQENSLEVSPAADAT
jgi:hypothetical protein